MASFGFAAMRGVFAATEHVAPRLTGRVAFELFCRTPNPKRVSRREASLLAAAAPFMDGARRHCLRAGDAGFVAYEFRPGGTGRVPTAVVIHGWGSRTAHMRGMIAALLERGLRVVAVDLPGHGASPGRRLNLAIAVAAIRQIADWFGPVAALIGHSFGGAVAVNAAVGSIPGIGPVSVGRLVLISAPSSMPAVFDDFSRFLRLGARSRMALADQVMRVAGRPLEEFVGADQLAGHAIPTLVIHAPDDKEVAFENARCLEAAGPHVRLVRAPGLGHRRILADDVVAAMAAAHAAGDGVATAAA